MKHALMTILLFPTLSFAGNNCKQIKQHQKAISLHIANYLNANTTSTSEGGPYQKQTLLCKNNVCSIKEDKNPTLTYEPDHPDADKNGYVSYPNISKIEERTTISALAKTIKILAKKCKTIAEVSIENGSTSHSINYHQGLIINDVFNFNKENQVLSLSRLYKDGHIQSINF